ncbi:MAG TPA: hypothetical protein VIN58_10070 [Roseateles sp.]
MPRRRILVAGLTEADRRRLEVFLLVDSDRLREDWRIVGEGPVDVYLYDADELPTIPGCVDRPPHQVRVVDAGRHPGPADLATLWRPLQYDDFVDILAAVEQHTPAAATTAAAPVITKAASPAPARFRLRRWPGTGLLDAIPRGLRMASFITVRHLSAEELSLLSGVALHECHRFLATMSDNDLLCAEPVEPRGWGSASALPRATKGTSRAGLDRSLLASLRAKLGIELKEH